jgi:phage pi2 protein 07
VGTNFQEDGSLIPDLEKRLRQQAEGFVHYVERFTS